MLKFLRKIAIFIVVLVVISFIKKYKINDDYQFIAVNDEIIDKKELLGDVKEDELIPIVDGVRAIVDKYPKVINGNIYLSLEFVKSYFNDDFYWDAKEKILTLTTLNKVLRMKTDELTYELNNNPMPLNIPVITIDNVPFIPLTLVEKFADYDFDKREIGTIVIKNKLEDKNVAIVKDDDSRVYKLRDDSSPLIQKVSSSDELVIQSDDDAIWTKVLTNDGFLGYIKKDSIDTKVVLGKPSIKEAYDYDRRMTFEGGLNLTWNYVSSAVANTKLKEKLEGVYGLDVISPTWFHFQKEDGTLSNLADLDYVREAHNRGIQVWALFSNKFDKKLTHEVLSSTTARKKVIKQLLYYAKIYELDGINVDFENVSKKDGEYFVQFMKELTPYLKEEDLVVSVDMYVPKPWTMHYGRKEVGEIVDYVMVMAYDEHWGTSPKAGSVASLPFVDDGIEKTLKEVPKEKVVLGLPFYTRIWKETTENGETKVKSKAVSMEVAFDNFSKEGAKFKWLEDIGQFYGEYDKDGVKYKVWLEDVNSIEAKMGVYKKYDLAGVASWQLGLEKKDVWNTLKKYLDK